MCLPRWSLLKRNSHQKRSDAATSSASTTENGVNKIFFSIHFAGPSGKSPREVAEELIDEFLTFDDRETKTQLLLELGQICPTRFNC